MLTITDAAKKQIAEILNEQKEEDHCIRVSVTGRGPSGFEYELTLLREIEGAADDVKVDAGGFTVLVDAKSVQDLKGATIDFVEGEAGAGFKMDNPNPVWTDPVAQRVQRVLDTEINPGVAAHGGSVALLDVKDATAYIQLRGGCQGCGMADVTLKQGIEVAIKKAVPQIGHVLDTTDHAAGTNPFYQPAKGGQSPFA